MFFWVGFLGGFFSANPAPAGHRSGRWVVDGGVRWGPLLRRDGGGGAGGGGCGVGPCAGARCRWERADSRLFSTGRRSDWASRPAPVTRKLGILSEYVLRIPCITRIRIRQISSEFK